jgi:hypothetical protein
MVTNPYFSNYNHINEQNLLDDLVVESHQIHGIDVYYLPRKVITKENTFREATVSAYDQAFLIDMYLKSTDGFEGEGEFLSKFGLELRDQIVMSVARRTFQNDIGKLLRIERPMEGDLIYFPLSKALYQIKVAQKRTIFYQLGGLYEFTVTAELFEYSNEVFSTGIPDIDNVYNGLSTKEDLNEPFPDIDDSLLDILDTQSQNTFFQEEGDKIVDEFSTKNPFGDV